MKPRLKSGRSGSRVLDGQAGLLKWAVEEIRHAMNFDHFHPLIDISNDKGRKKYSKMKSEINRILDHLWMDEYKEEHCIREAKELDRMGIKYYSDLCEDGREIYDDVGHFEEALPRLKEHFKKCTTCKVPKRKQR